MKVLINNAGLKPKDVFKKTDYEVWEYKEKREKRAMEWVEDIVCALTFVATSIIFLFVAATI